LRQRVTGAARRILLITFDVIGPRIAAKKWEDVFPTITSGYAYPWEDLKVKE